MLFPSLYGCKFSGDFLFGGKSLWVCTNFFYGSITHPATASQRQISVWGILVLLQIMDVTCQFYFPSENFQESTQHVVQFLGFIIRLTIFCVKQNGFEGRNWSSDKWEKFEVFISLTWETKARLWVMFSNISIGVQICTKQLILICVK